MSEEVVAAPVNQNPPPAVLPARQRCLVLGLVAGLMLLGVTLCVPVQEASPWGWSWKTFGAMTAIGALLACVTLLAAWAVLRPPLLVRGMRTLGFVLLLVVGFTWGLRHSGVSEGDSTLTACFPLLVFALLAGAWGLLGWWRRWRLELAEATAGTQRTSDTQFTLREILLWTAGVAGLLALTKYVPPDGHSLNAQGVAVVTVTLLVLLGLSFLTAVASAGLFLGQSRRRLWAVATVGLVLTTAAVGAGLVWAGIRSTWLGLSLEQKLEYLTRPGQFLVGFLAVLWAALAVVRFCGYRLVRRTAAPSLDSCPFVVAPIPQRSTWRTPFPYLVAVLLLLGLAMGTGGLLLEGPRSDARLIHSWTARGVYTYFQPGYSAICFEPNQPILDETLRRLGELVELCDRRAKQDASADSIARGCTLSFRGAKLSDAQLRWVLDLHALRGLDLDLTSISDAGLEQLVGLDHLESLSLSGTAISDAGLVSLQRLPALGWLGLDSTKITNAGLAQLRNFPALETLSLKGPAINGSGLAQLRGAPHLKCLSLPAATGDDDLAALEGLETLTVLWLEGAKVSDAGLAHLRGLKQLRYLNLAGTQVNDAGLQELDHWPNLEFLDISGTLVIDAGAKLLESWPQLKVIRLGPRVTLPAARRLKQARPDAEVDYCSSPGSWQRL